ncbi:MAG TPA: DUF4836 family protein [Phaeodactylibacter sp.]|nr:DUF4836 family protein [Phaeodactylibacter sp.]
MKLFRKTALFLLLALVAISSLQAQNLEQYIPKNASFVMSINLAHLDSKISFEKLKQYDFYKESMKEMEKKLSKEDENLKKLITSPSELGIDAMSESFVFGKMDKDVSLFGFVFNISDHKKFSNFFKNTVIPESTTGTMGHIGKFQTFADDELTFAWNKNVGILIGGKPNNASPLGEANTAMVAAYTKQIINKSKANSILNDKRFVKATAGRKSDIRMWMDYEWVMELQMKDSKKQLEQLGMGSMLDGLKEMYKDSDYLVELNFNDGAIVMDSKLFSNQKTLDKIRKMSSGKLNKDFFKYLPKDNLMGYFSMAMNTENFADGMFEMFDPAIKDAGMTRPQMENMAIDALKGMGIELDRKGLYEIMRGDMVFAVTGMREFSIKKTQYDEDFNRIEVETKQKLPEFTFMMTYGQEKALMKMVQMGVDAGVLSKVANGFKLAVPSSELPMDMFLVMDNNILFLTNNTDLATGKLSKGYSKSNRMTKEQQKLMKENSGAFYWDIPQSLNAAAEYAKEEGINDKTATKMINVSKQSLESMILKTDKNIKNSQNTEFSFNFVNKRMNSLEQLFSYFNEIYLTAMNSGGM